MNGYSLLPVKPSLATYQFLVMNKGKMLIHSMVMTVKVVISDVIQCFGGPFLCL